MVALIFVFIVPTVDRCPLESFIEVPIQVFPRASLVPLLDWLKRQRGSGVTTRRAHELCVVAVVFYARVFPVSPAVCELMDFVVWLESVDRVQLGWRLWFTPFSFCVS
ncbi:hypothetical protein BaRGS_00001819 [Batillaria attramentaria]|uniref:Secreted protein n=1 Tax=Batillaria attramentaria TaxID=370345 RepID=A0ABD0M653_9CAEN